MDINYNGSRRPTIASRRKGLRSKIIDFTVPAVYYLESRETGPWNAKQFSTCVTELAIPRSSWRLRQFVVVVF